MKRYVQAAKVVLARQLCRPIVGRAAALIFSDRIPSRGHRIDTTSALVRPEIKASILFGFYEAAERRFVDRFVDGSEDVVEIGSSLGVISARLARRLHPGRRLLCVEAEPQLTTTIERNVRTNAPSALFEVVNAAVDYSLDGATIAFHRGSNNTGSRVGQGDDPSSLLSVPRTTLSELLLRHAVKRYDLVSDIEGSEAGFLLEDLQTVRRCRRMVIELHEGVHRGVRYTAEDLRDRLLKGGFATLAQHGNVLALENSSPLELQ